MAINFLEKSHGVAISLGPRILLENLTTVKLLLLLGSKDHFLIKNKFVFMTNNEGIDE